MIAEFTVIGQPRAKQRPRVTRSGCAYTPKETVQYENLVKTTYMYECNKWLEGAIRARITVVFDIPKSWSKKDKERATTGQLKHTSKPDVDNLVKSILDSLNGVAYHDDSQVYEVEVIKKYGTRPRVEVILESEEEECTNS